MKLFKVLLGLTLLTHFHIAQAYGEACESVYGKHKLFHHTKNWAGPKKFSEPKLVEIEIKRDGTLVSEYHFDQEYFETAIFSQNFPQLSYFNSNKRGGWEIGCLAREPECERLRDDVSSYILNSLIYLDIENESDIGPKTNVALNRKKVLRCADAIRSKIVNSTVY